MFRTKHLLLVVTVSCLLSSAGRIAFGQAVSGTINGYVYDKSEASIAAARVTITNTETGAVIGTYNGRLRSLHRDESSAGYVFGLRRRRAGFAGWFRKISFSGSIPRCVLTCTSSSAP